MKFKIKNIVGLNIDNTFLQVNGVGWKVPEYVSIKSMIDLIDISINNKSNTFNLVSFVDQDVSIFKSPESYSDGELLHVTADDNFLYVWINDKWKRVALSDF